MEGSQLESQWKFEQKNDKKKDVVGDRRLSTESNTVRVLSRRVETTDKG